MCHESWNRFGERGGVVNRRNLVYILRIHADTSPPQINFRFYGRGHRPQLIASYFAWQGASLESSKIDNKSLFDQALTYHKLVMDVENK